MLNVNVKPQNKNRVFSIFALGGIGGIISSSNFKGVVAFIIDGAMILVLCVLLGMLTSKVFGLLNFDPFEYFNPDPEILESAESHQTIAELEDKKDSDALNYGIIWAILFLFI